MAKLGRPISWPEPKTLLAKRLQDILPEEGLAKISQKYFNGVSKETVKKYLSGDSEPPISILEKFYTEGGVSFLYLLFGVGHPADTIKGLKDEEINDQPPKLIYLSADKEAIPTFSISPQSLPVIGSAAADNSEASKAGLLSPDNIEEITVLKEDYRLIQIMGNSMEPVILDGQYAVVGHEILKTEPIQKSGWIGVVQVYCDDIAIDGSVDFSSCGPEDICTFCKRIYKVNGDSEQLLLTSINSSECPPFTIERSKVLHLWPVQGVFFAGKGVVPDD